MIKPTVGCVVLFVPDKDCYDFGFWLQKGKQYAAIVACVHGERLVNLSIVDGSGKQFSRTSVYLRQPEDPVPSGDYCEWMEYQIGQAAKTTA